MENMYITMSFPHTCMMLIGIGLKFPTFETYSMYYYPIATCTYISCISFITRPSEGEGEGRPGTHCMSIRHHSPDFGESYYVWIYCLYTFTDIFMVNIRKMRCMHKCAVSTRPSSLPPLSLRRPGDEAYHSYAWLLR